MYKYIWSEVSQEFSWQHWRLGEVQLLPEFTADYKNLCTQQLWPVNPNYSLYSTLTCMQFTPPASLRREVVIVEGLPLHHE